MGPLGSTGFHPHACPHHNNMHLRLLLPNHVQIEAGGKGKGKTNHWNRSKMNDQTIKLVLEGHMKALEDKSRLLERQGWTVAMGDVCKEIEKHIGRF